MSIITHQELTAWLDQVATANLLAAPRLVDGVLLYRPVTHSAEIAWGYTRPVLSAKEFFFPATERLLQIQKTGQQVRLIETLPEGELVLFGIRPCDARGLQALDALFIDTPPIDPYYARRRANTTLVGLACKEEGPSCFCTRMGGAPDDASGMDVMLQEVDGGYVAQAITPKGERLLQEAGFTAQPGRPPTKKKADLPPLDAWPPEFADAYWAQMAERCLSCRICAYVCPTCRCFDVRDEAVSTPEGSEEFERLRCWDACTRETYRTTAGGHNPRADKGMRLRNRFFCKFYYYPEQYGPTGCTGCGRCVDACPVNIDITEVLEHVTARIME
ncbi:MAG: 4Fe-4S dicluster domain-containing protein [Anaerolineales bacterium]|nr:4Fe-4S dicluster domain-containing protein [Anaerolineales bacterium]